MSNQATITANKLKASDYSDYKFDLNFPKHKTVATTEYEKNKVQLNETLPFIPRIESDEANIEEILYNLRHFHLGDPRNIGKTEAVSDDYIPALLHAYRDVSKVRYDYPLFLYPAVQAGKNSSAEQFAKPISVVLQEIIELFAPQTESARILKDNLSRLEKNLRSALREQEEPVDAIILLSKLGEALQTELALDAENNARLQADFKQLLNLIPEQSQLLGYGRYAAIHLLHHAICSCLLPRRKQFKKQAEQAISQLKTILDVDRCKLDESIEPKMMKNSIGVVGNHFNYNLLSDIMLHSQGSAILSEERSKRIFNAITTLENFLNDDDSILVRFVYCTDGDIEGNWLENIPTLSAFTHSNPCTKGTNLFDKQATKWAEIFAAMRIAQLEIQSVYDPNIHDPWFTNFSWEAFSKQEILLLPAVIVLETGERAVDESMVSLSKLLRSGRPIQILLRDRAHSSSHGSSIDNPFLDYRLELGYFGISHRQAVVSQSSSARHQHLLTQFLSALNATRTSLHIINTGVQRFVHGINAWLVAGAALESRAHPFFHINPDAGDFSADRMNFAGNPQPEMDWTLNKFQYKNAQEQIVDSELAFTFADYVLLIPRTHEHFRLVPKGVNSEDLIPLDKYLSNSQALENFKIIPFIWAVNAQGELRQLVVSRALIFACQDRLNYWHILQELAGIKNKYVDIAVEKARIKIRSEQQVEKERLSTKHTEQLAQTKQETAGKVMQRLTDVLLGLDLTAGGSQLGFLSTSEKLETVETVETVVEAEVEPKPEVQEEVIFEDPWIDSDLCTSCNDCLNLNTVLFVYNESKQAVLGDLNSGTYAQLVEAAELCPAKCIHPGKPRNDSESGLDELIKRAEPFNKM
ncbi:MAG: ferredoxin [Thiomargarita sp.]|nr:ferredoxin [Thiomargarita sp.]